MPRSTSEIERVLKRTTVKHDAILAQIYFLRDLAHKVESNEDILPLFRARKKDIDIFRAQLLLEQDGIFDLLLKLKREKRVL